jgi:signal transduction histidine kinase
MPLRTRFMMYVTALLVGLVVLVLFVIEQREVRAIFEEQKDRGILTAEYLIQLNIDLFLFGDSVGVEEDIEKRIDENLIYVVFYDQNLKTFAANDFIKGFYDIYADSNLASDAKKGDYFMETKNIATEDKSGRYLRVMEIEIPIYVEGSSTRFGSIKIGISLEEMHDEERKTRLMLILIGCSGLLIGVGGAALLARRITRPLDKLVDGTIKISRGDFSQAIHIDTQDEVGDLAQSFNEMSQQLQLARKRMEAANRRLVHAEKLASIGRISASIAHEIRNPLTSVKLNIQKVMESEELDDIDREHLDISQEGIGHIETFIKELLNFTRVSELQLAYFSAKQIMDESVKMMRNSLKLRDVELVINIQEGLPHVLVDGDKIRQVLLNILHNACEAVEKGGEIVISLSLLKGRRGRKLKILVSDNGPGIPEKDRENIFEPFYTTKSTGIGLGLANARKIIEQHKGSIRIIKSERPGAHFEILIPCEEEK